MGKCKETIYSTLTYPEEAHASAAQYYLSKETPENIVEALYHLLKCNNTKKIIEVLEDESLNQRHGFIEKEYALSISSIIESLKTKYIEKGNRHYLYMLKRKAEQALNIKVEENTQRSKTSKSISKFSNP